MELLWYTLKHKSQELRGKDERSSSWRGRQPGVTSCVTPTSAKTEFSWVILALPVVIPWPTPQTQLAVWLYYYFSPLSSKNCVDRWKKVVLYLSSNPNILDILVKYKPAKDGVHMFPYITYNPAIYHLNLYFCSFPDDGWRGRRESSVMPT